MHAKLKGEQNATDEYKHQKCYKWKEERRGGGGGEYVSWCLEPSQPYWVITGKGGGGGGIQRTQNTTITATNERRI